MEPVKFKETIIIEGIRDHIFDFTQDYNNRLKWDTFLKRAELTDGATLAGIGVKAFCKAKNGIGMLTEYVTYIRPKVTAIKMVKGPYMFRSFLGSWTFKEISEQRTEVIFLYSFSLRFPFSLFTGLIKNNLRSNVKQRLVDLKMNIEGKTVMPGHSIL